MKVLLVEDSATVAAYIASILGSENDIQLLRVANNAEDGVRMALEARPDVVLMDIRLPDHDGLWAIEQIMRDAPCPVVVLSGHLNSRERDITFESLRAGAVDVLAKPAGLTPAARDAFRQSLVSTVRLMSTAVVVKRTRRTPPQSAERERTGPGHIVADQVLGAVRYVLIGASTGGPELLYRILSSLPAPLPLPVLITQHTLEGFDESLAQWLACTGHDVRVAVEGEKPVAGKVLLAPADKHLKATHTGMSLQPARRGESIASVDAMFDSAAKVWGEQCIAFVLTGMGKDGAAGMRTLHERGALTVAQSNDSCVVASMPDSARALGGVRWVLSPSEIVSVLKQLLACEGTAAASEARRGR